MKRFPFKWKNSIGYLTATSLQLLISLYEARYLGCFVNLALGGVMFALVFAKDIMMNLQAINESIKAKKPESDIIKLFIVVINIHTDVKELSALE